jgi:alanine racemase
VNDAGQWQKAAIPSRAGAAIVVDLMALQRNYRRLAQLAKPAQCGASLKANAYGIGLAQAAQALYAAGCRTFFVAYPDEGRQLRTVLAGPDIRDVEIYVLCGLLTGEPSFYEAQRLRPVLSGPAELAEWISYCRRQERKLPAGLHIETGMNRLAFTEPQLKEIAADRSVFDHFEMSLVLSHLANAEEPDDEYNEMQRRRFDDLRMLLPRAPASLANSAGIFLGSSYCYELVRPGIALYGGNPLPDRANPCETVVHFLGKVLQVRDIAAGTGVGYGSSWRARGESRIAVIGAGYGDGYPRALSLPANSKPSRVRIGDFFAPIVGRISMDMITVDVTDLPASAVPRGAVVELMGAHVTVDEIASKAGTNSFEILTRLGTRCPRLYSAFDS